MTPPMSSKNVPEAGLPVIPTVTQEYDSERKTKSPAKKRRRSLRNTNRIILPDQSSLQGRRMDSFFFRKGSEANETIQVGTLTLQRIHSNPNVYVIDNFLTATDLDYLQSKIDSGKFEKSFVDKVNAENSESTYDTQHRTSTFLSFGKRQDTRIAAMEQRAADLLGCWTSQLVEPLQLVRYLPGQFFGVHHDMGDLDDDGAVALPPKTPYSKRRLVTIFCYQNEVEQGGGGSTYFPACGDLRVSPTPGRAVLFANVLANGEPDPRTIHAGEAVKKGTKYGLNMWICEE